MPSFGGATGTPVTTPTVYDPYEELLARPHCAVPLSRYVKLINIDEAGFWGVAYDQQGLTGCAIWREDERMNVAHMLAQAQQEIEQVLSFPLCPTWIVGDVADEPNNDGRWTDWQAYHGRQVTRYSRLIAAGVRATETIATAQLVSHGTDPATIGPVATNATDPDEIHVYYPGSEREITPSSVSISGGNVTIRIPRYRLVAASLLNNPKEGLDYEDLSNFQSSVKILREYNDPSTNALLVRPHCQNNDCNRGCQECTQNGCIYIRDKERGIVDVRPATYDSDNSIWTGNGVTVCGPYAYARMNYYCGIQYLSQQMEMAIVRLAHSRLEECPCDCSRVQMTWSRDRVVPQLLTRERLNCPFGLSAGEWYAWTVARTLRDVKMAVLA